VPYYGLYSYLRCSGSACVNKGL